MGYTRRTKAAARFVSRLNPGCSFCNGTGWKPAAADPTRVTRCHCWYVEDRVAKQQQRASRPVVERFDGKAAAAGQ